MIDSKTTTICPLKKIQWCRKRNASKTVLLGDKKKTVLLLFNKKLIFLLKFLGCLIRILEIIDCVRIRRCIILKGLNYMI